MNLQFWKHKQKEEVISNNCYTKLPLNERGNYYSTSNEPTHKVEDDDNGGFMTSMLLSESMSGIMDSSSFSSDSGFGGFDGGSGGGGGADLTW